MGKHSLRLTEFILIGVTLSGCRKGDEGLTHSTKLYEPKAGTAYVEGLPREIIWRKDGGEMVLVPGGEFLIGKAKEKLSLPAFYIDKYPVTNEGYGKFVKETGHRAPFVDEEWAKALNWQGEDYPKGKGEHPVVLVSLADAAAYCKWAGKTLSTDERWEKAARGSDGRSYPWGNEFDDKKCNTHFSGIGDTTPVGKYPDGVSPYGCHDMAGNVWEWTVGRLGAFVRGGSFFDGDAEARCDLRVLPESPMDTRSSNIGFRCCWVPPRQSGPENVERRKP